MQTKRHTARENTFKLIYERLINGEDNELTLGLVLNATPDEQKDYVESVYSGVNLKYEFLSEVIGRYASDYKLERVYKVDLAVMLLSAYEILFMPEIPAAASINEAVELVKLYSTEKSFSFINGILASVNKDREDLLKDEQGESTAD